MIMTFVILIDDSSYCMNFAEGKQEYAPELVHASVKSRNPLSEKEQQILRLIEGGKTSREITSTLYLSQVTVRNYTSEIKESNRSRFNRQEKRVESSDSLGRTPIRPI